MSNFTARVVIANGLQSLIVTNGVRVYGHVDAMEQPWKETTRLQSLWSAVARHLEHGDEHGNRKLNPKKWIDLDQEAQLAHEDALVQALDEEACTPLDQPVDELHPNGAPMRYREKDGRLLCKTIDCPWLPRVNGFCNACKTGM
jgi:hypothetical protein